MIRTIAAALAAFVFVAFSARAEEPKATTPTTSDAAKSDSAAAKKSAKKSAKKAKKAKKSAAPADSSATPPAK